MADSANWTVDDIISPQKDDDKVYNSYPNVCYWENGKYYTIRLVCSKGYHRERLKKQNEDLEYMYHNYGSDSEKWRKFLFKGKGGLTLLRLKVRNFTGHVSLSEEEARDPKILHKTMREAAKTCYIDEPRMKPYVTKLKDKYVWSFSEKPYLWVLVIDKCIGFVRMARAGIVLRERSITNSNSNANGIDCIRVTCPGDNKFGENLSRILVFAREERKESLMLDSDDSSPDTLDREESPLPRKRKKFEIEDSDPGSATKKTRSETAHKFPAGYILYSDEEQENVEEEEGSDDECPKSVNYSNAYSTIGEMAREHVYCATINLFASKSKLKRIEEMDAYLRDQLDTLNKERIIYRRRIRELDEERKKWNKHILDGAILENAEDEKKFFEVRFQK